LVSADNRFLGDSAENLAFDFLKMRGLVPLRRNFRCRLGELDLIMRDDSCLVIIEVRYRTARSLVSAEQTIDYRKQAKIIRTAAMFLAWNERFAAMPMRFDVVGIDVDADGERTVHWIRDAFRPGDARL
jgi:putative endonuclease